MTPLIASMSRLVPDPETGYWFDIGAIPIGGHFELDPELMIYLPYDVVFIVGQNADGRALVRATFKEGEQTKKSSIGVTGFIFTRGVVQIKPFAYILHDDKRLAVWPEGAIKRDETMLALGLLDTLLRRLDIAHTAYQPKPVNTFTNRRKIAQGRRPSYEWRTVVVQPRPKSSPQGGTHASPRAHDRRGHWRTLKDKRVWVKPCRVGNPADGQVFHDYKIISDSSSSSERLLPA